MPCASECSGAAAIFVRSSGVALRSCRKRVLLLLRRRPELPLAAATRYVMPPPNATRCRPLRRDTGWEKGTGRFYILRFLSYLGAETDRDGIRIPQRDTGRTFGASNASHVTRIRNGPSRGSLSQPVMWFGRFHRRRRQARRNLEGGPSLSLPSYSASSVSSVRRSTGRNSSLSLSRVPRSLQFRRGAALGAERTAASMSSSLLTGTSVALESSVMDPVPARGHNCAHTPSRGRSW